MLQLLEDLCYRGGVFVNQSSHPFIHNESQGNGSYWPFRPSDDEPAYQASAYKKTTFETLWIAFQINMILCIFQLFLFWIGLRCAPHIFAPRLDPSEVPKWPLGWICKIWKDMRVGAGNLQAPRDRWRRPSAHEAGEGVEGQGRRKRRPSRDSNAAGPPATAPEREGAMLLADRLNNLDGAVMVRFCILGFKFSLVASICAAGLLPWYYDGGTEEFENPNANFTKFNLANLKDSPNKHRFWPSVGCAYFLFWVWVHFSMVEWSNFEVMRKEHFKRLACGKMDAERPGAAQAARSVLVELVPSSFREVTGMDVKRFFGKLFPHAPEGLDTTYGGVHSAVVQPETAELHGKVDAIFLAEGKKRLRDLRNAMAPLVRKAREERVQKMKLQKQFTAGTLPSPSARSRPESLLAEHSVSFTPSDLMRTPGRRPTAREAAPAPDAVQETDSRGNVWVEVAESGEIVAKAARVTAEGMLQRVQQAASLFQDIVVPSYGGIHSGSSTAFVTFYSVSDRVAAEQLVLVPRDGQALESHRWLVSPAPEAADIIWANASVPHTQRWVRTWLVRFLLLIVMIFWIVPITFIQVWTRLDNWNIPWIRSLQDYPVGQLVYTLLSSYLPVLAQMGLMYALPELLEAVGRRIEQEKIKSRVQVVVVGRYLRFLMVTIYITIIGGGLLQSMCKILEDPYDVFDLLQEEVPQVATYFISYVMARAGLSAPMLLLFAIFSTCERDDKQRILVRPNYAMEASNLVLVMVLGMTYCIIAPMITFACTAYFALTSLIYSWLFLYVYTPEYDCKGQMWSHMFNGSLVGFLLGAASLAGIASTYVGPTSGSFIATLGLCLLVTMLFPYFRITYGQPAEHIPLEVAREVDMGVSAHIDIFLNAGYYFDPVIQDLYKGTLRRGSTCWSCLCCCCQRRKPEKEGYKASTHRGDDSDASSIEFGDSASSEDDDDGCFCGLGKSGTSPPSSASSGFSGDSEDGDGDTGGTDDADEARRRHRRRQGRGKTM